MSTFFSFLLLIAKILAVDYSVSWTNGPNQLPQNVAYSCIVTTEENVVYLFGGRVPASPYTSNRDWTLKWDTKNSQQWEILTAKSPDPFYCFAQNVVYNVLNKLIYIIIPTSTFNEEHDRIYIFNTSNDQYITNHNIPNVITPLDHSCSTIDVDNNLIYLFGQADDHHLQILNLTTNKWIDNSFIKQSPQDTFSSIGNSACIVYNNYFYTFGGGTGLVLGSTDKIYKYSYVDNIWTTLDTLPQDRQAAKAILIDNIGNNIPLIFIIGGRNTSEYYNDYLTFNPLTDTLYNLSGNWGNSNYAYVSPIYINKRMIVWGGFNTNKYTSTDFENSSVSGHIITLSPTNYPTINPTYFPSFDPTTQPTNIPTLNPTTPTTNPTLVPSELPTNQPTNEPTSLHPTYNPSMEPTTDPTTYIPTFYLTMQPSGIRTSIIKSTESVESTSISIGSGSIWKENETIIIVMIIVIGVIIIVCILGCLYYKTKKLDHETRKFDSINAENDDNTDIDISDNRTGIEQIDHDTKNLNKNSNEIELEGGKTNTHTKISATPPNKNEIVSLLSVASNNHQIDDNNTDEELEDMYIMPPGSGKTPVTLNGLSHDQQADVSDA